MIYVTFNPRDCPDMPFFRYVWYWYRYFSKVYKFTKYNLINLRFGRFMKFFHKLSFTFIHSFKLVSIDYDVYFKDKFDKYGDFVKNIQQVLSYGYVLRLVEYFNELQQLEINI